MARSVLVVEDVALERRLLVAALKKGGLDVVAAANGRQAVDAVLADGTSIGLILLDMRLPDQSGLDVYRAVRHHAPHVKIVLCPGQADSQETLTAIAEGADGCLPKPLDMKQVLAVAAAHLGR